MTLDSPLVYRSVTIQIKSSFGLSSLSLPNPLFLFSYPFFPRSVEGPAVTKKERRVGKEPALILWFTKDWKGEQTDESRDQEI